MNEYTLKKRYKYINKEESSNISTNKRGGKRQRKKDNQKNYNNQA